MAEKTKPASSKAAPAAVERLAVFNDKGGIGKSIVIQGLSLELAAAGVEHRVIEAESNPRLQRVLGRDRVAFHAPSEDSLSCTRFPWTAICPTGDRHDEVQHERNRKR